jgi:uncharacterized protein DUF4339
MSQGNDFANYPLSNADGGASEEVWFVAVASDDIKQMNVDQLDEAFRLGIITSATAVWTEGMDAWAPLGQVADLDSDGASDADGDAAQGRSKSGSEPEISQTLQSAGNNSGNDSGNDFGRGDLRRGHGAGDHGLASGYGAVTLQSAQNSFLPGPSSVAPVTSSYAPSGSYAPSPFGLSTGPVALNVDEDAPPAQRGRRIRPERWALAGAAVIAIGVAAFNNLDLFSSSSAAENAPAPAPALAARPYDGAEPTPSAAKSGSESEAPATAKASLSAGDSPIGAPNAAPAASSPVASSGARAAAPVDDAEAPASSKAKGDSLKGSFSKAFNKKAATPKATKVKPRKAASRATTKPRAKGKKPSVARSQSAFDPLNDSLP